MILKKIKVFILLCPLVYFGCIPSSRVDSGEDVAVESGDKANRDNKKSERSDALNIQTSEQELKMAKLWARIDEIEVEQARLKEKLRVLEKGFVLGLIPEELDADESKKAPKNLQKSNSKPEKNNSESIKNKNDVPIEISEDLNKDETTDSDNKLNTYKTNEDQSDVSEEYVKALATAHDQFRSGNYGRAIVEFTSVQKKFGDKIDGGATRYWIAKSWVALKEFNDAKKILVEFIAEDSRSVWIPRAKLELARIEWRLGLRETALKLFKDIIDSYPLEDAAEMAKMEIDQLGRSL